MTLRLVAAVAGLASLTAFAFSAQEKRPAAVVPAQSAAREVLERRCVSCHNAKSASGGLDLTTDAGRFRKAATAAAVVPGKPEASELLRRLDAQGSKPSMPLGQKPLTDTERTALASWVRTSGKLAGTLSAKVHWAWTAPVRPVTPAVAGDS
ncbi:MAG: c-type cytochrome domain-containing protein, partial [Armatimonadaceae bacterium]